MAIDIQHGQSATREERLGAITGYHGTIGEMVAGACTRSLSSKERLFSQASACASGCAQGYLGRIQDAIVINHAPIGCASDAIGGNFINQWGEWVRGWKRTNVKLFSTNMNEQDTVFGATGKLKDTIREVWRRHRPEAIFITTSCASGIIGDDVLGACEDLREEIPIPLAPVFCEGFKTKVWASGFDAAFHAVLHWIVQPPRPGVKSNKVTVVNFQASAHVEVTRLLARFGLEPVFVIPHSNVEQLRRLSESVATLSVCGTLGGYLGTALEEQYGVPYVRTLQPHGTEGFASWLRGLGAAVGKSEVAEAILAEEVAKYAPEIEALRAELKGTTAVVGMGPSFSHNYVRVLRELGVEVVWGASWHFDQNYDNGIPPESSRRLAKVDENFPVSVTDQQNFELLNLLNTLKPDFYVSRHPGSSVWATKMGIASVPVTDEYAAFAVQGIVDLGHRLLDALKNRSLAKRLASRIALPYTKWWLEQDAFTFLEE